MSAYLCSGDTFDYLASALVTYSLQRHGVNIYSNDSMPDVASLVSDGVLEVHHNRLSGITDSDKIAEVLRNQNIRSLQARYPDDYETMLDDQPYTFTRVESSKITPAAVLKSCACLEYQSCESSDYRETYAYRILDTIRDLAINSIPGYEDAPWGWERDSKVGA